MTRRPMRYGLVAVVACLAACGSRDQPVRASETDVAGTWTSADCGAEVALAADRTATAHNYKDDEAGAVTSGTGKWSLENELKYHDTSIVSLQLDSGSGLNNLYMYNRDDKMILLEVIGDPDNGVGCVFSRK